MSNHVISAFQQGHQPGLSSCQDQDNWWQHLRPYLPFSANH
jgi:hypothetical protein